MRILFVTNQIPYPPDNGVRIVSHHAMRLMREASHELALAVLTEEVEDNEKRFAKAAAFCMDGMAWWMPLPKRRRLDLLFSSLISNHPFFIEHYRSAPFRQKLLSLVERFGPDAIHFDLITMAQYRDVAPGGVRTVASINDSHSLSLVNFLKEGNFSRIESLYRRLEYRQTRRYEAKTYPQFDVTHVMSGADEEHLRSLNPAIRTAVVPNGVDNSLLGIAGRTMGKTDVIFVAQLTGHNVSSLQQFVELGWPVVRRQCPDVKLHIVGRIGPEVQRLRARTEHTGSVVFRGYVDRLADAYCECGISVAPVNKNSGIVNKVIESMAAGLVTVGFKKTFAGIPHAIEGQHFLSAEDYPDMGQAIVDIILDEPRRRAIQIKSRRLAAEHYLWSGRAAAYENMYGSPGRNIN